MNDKNRAIKYPLIKSKYIVLPVILTFIIVLYYTNDLEKTVGVSVFTLILGLPGLRSPIEEKELSLPHSSLRKLEPLRIEV